MIIDAHHHLWSDANAVTWLGSDGHEPLRRPFTIEQFRGVLLDNAVRGSVVVESGARRPEELPQLLAIAASRDEVLGVVGWLDPEGPDASTVVERVLEDPHASWLRGLRIQAQSRDADYLETEAVESVVRTLAGRALALELVLLPSQLRAATSLARRHPELTIVIDHCAKPNITCGIAAFDGWHAGITGIADLPNVVCKVSGLVTEANWSDWSVTDLQPYVAAAIEMFEPHRLMFGSDWPVCLLASSYEGVLAAVEELTAHLGPEQRSAVFNETAIRTYRLDVTP